MPQVFLDGALSEYEIDLQKISNETMLGVSSCQLNLLHSDRIDSSDGHSCYISPKWSKIFGKNNFVNISVEVEQEQIYLERVVPILK